MTSPARSKTLATWLLAACAAAALSIPADAAVLCARKGNGTSAPSEGAGVKVRSVCKDNEVTLDPGTLGLAASLTTTIVRSGNPITTTGIVSTPANCAAGEVATGGGALATATGGGLAAVRSSRPQPETAGGTPTGWRVTVQNLSDIGSITATPFVVCAVTTP